MSNAPARRNPSIDYTRGSFLITVNAHRRQSCWGRIGRTELHISPLGECVAEAWAVVVEQADGVRSEAFVVMPDHVHAVVTLTHGNRSLSQYVASFKSRATRRAREQDLLAADQTMWQPSFHDSLLRSRRAVLKAIQYVETNPERAIRRRNRRRRGDG